MSQSIRVLGESLHPTEVAELVELIDTVGDLTLSRETGLSRSAIARAAAGLRVYAGTRALIRQALAQHRQAA